MFKVEDGVVKHFTISNYIQEMDVDWYEIEIIPPCLAVYKKTNSSSPLKMINMHTKKIVDICCLQSVLKSIHILSLGWNIIKDICIFQNLPNSLVELHLNSNEIEDISCLTNLPSSLVELDLSWNEIEDISVFKNNLPRSLISLGIYGNPIVKNDIIQLIRFNPNLRGFNVEHEYSDEFNNPSRKVNRVIMALLSPSSKTTRSSIRKFRQSRDIFGLIKELLYNFHHK